MSTCRQTSGQVKAAGLIQRLRLFPGDPRHGASADQDGSDAQPLGAQSDHGDGGGGPRPAAAHNQRGSHRLSNVRHPSQHGPEDRLL